MFQLLMCLFNVGCNQNRNDYEDDDEDDDDETNSASQSLFGSK